MAKIKETLEKTLFSSPGRFFPVLFSDRCTSGQFNKDKKEILSNVQNNVPLFKLCNYENGFQKSINLGFVLFPKERSTCRANSNS